MHSTCEKQTDGSDVLAIGGAEIASLLSGKELELIDIVKAAYALHGRHESSVPHSTFLLFPNSPADRIIALPAWLGGSVNSAGVKWIASFPGNIEHGIDRASAILVLNSMSTGRPKAIMEGSIISAMRTAASAALAAQALHTQPGSTAGLIGCGVINFEIAHFLLAARPEIRSFIIFDLDQEHAQAFRERGKVALPGIEIHIAGDLRAVFKGTTLISFATTAAKPHIHDLSDCAPGSVILHISLRDLSPEIIRANDNVVDDLAHVCRAQTSIHLAEQQAGNRDFVRCTLADVLTGAATPKSSDSAVTIFSPFGLGILDVALGEYVLSEALTHGKGSVMRSFLPDSWSRMAIPAYE